MVPMIVCQDNSQLYDIYGQHGGTGILSSMIRIYYACNNEVTARMVSAQCGSTTKKTTSRVRKTGFELDGGSVSSSSTKLPLITPDEVLQLSGMKEIILVEKRFPILCDKLNYLTDKNFKERRLASLPLPAKVTASVMDESTVLATSLGLTEDEMNAVLWEAMFVDIPKPTGQVITTPAHTFEANAHGLTRGEVEAAFTAAMFQVTEPTVSKIQ